MDCISSRIYSGFIWKYQLGKLSYLYLVANITKIVASQN